MQRVCLLWRVEENFKFHSAWRVVTVHYKLLDEVFHFETSISANPDRPRDAASQKVDHHAAYRV